MTMLGLDPDEKKPVGKYSLGMRQRLGFAQAFMENPDVLLLDEPFSSLDVLAAAQLREVVREQLHGTTTIVVSHTVADAHALADRLLILEHGRISREGVLDEVLSAPDTPFAQAVAASQ